MSNEYETAVGHALACVVAQLGSYLLTADSLIGGLIALAFFYGREAAQAQRKICDRMGASIKTSPWWWGLLPHDWSRDGRLDIAIPAVVVAVVT